LYTGANETFSVAYAGGEGGLDSELDCQRGEAEWDEDMVRQLFDMMMA